MCVCVVTEVYQVHLSQLCICSHQCNCQSNLFTLYGPWEHRSWTSACFLVSTSTAKRDPSGSRAMDPDKSLWCSWDHIHHMTPATKQTMDIYLAFSDNMDLDINTDQATVRSWTQTWYSWYHSAVHHHGPRWQRRTTMSMCPPLGALSMNINEASGCSTDHRCLCGLQW